MIGYTNKRRSGQSEHRLLAPRQSFNDKENTVLNNPYLQKYQQKASYGPYHSFHCHVIPNQSRHWLLRWLLRSPSMARDLMDANYWDWKPMKLKLEVKGHLLAMCQDLDRKLDSRVLIGSIARMSWVPFDFGFPKKSCLKDDNRWTSKEG